MDLDLRSEFKFFAKIWCYNIVCERNCYLEFIYFNFCIFLSLLSLKCILFLQELNFCVSGISESLQFGLRFNFGGVCPKTGLVYRSLTFDFGCFGTRLGFSFSLTCALKRSRLKFAFNSKIFYSYSWITIAALWGKTNVC